MKLRCMPRAVVALSFAVAAAATAADRPEYGAFGLDLGARGAAVRPGDDFWSYANGGWARSAPIGPRSDAVGVSVQMREKVDTSVRRIVEDMASHPAYGLAGRQIGALYLSWMDEGGIETRGAAVLAPYLARIRAAASYADVQALFSRAEYASPVAVDVEVHPTDPHRYILTIGQGGLGLPRDYYLQDGERYDRVRQAYRAYVRRIQQLAGMDDVDARTDAIIALETALATAQWSAAESRDIARMTDLETRSALETRFPGFDWTRLLGAYRLDPATQVVVNHNTAIVELGRLSAATPLQTWKDYLAYRFVSDHAEDLPKAFADARFDLYGKALGGMQAGAERWKQGVRLVDDTLGDAVGRIYLDRYYPPAASRQIHELVEDLRAAYRDRINSAGWMDAATRQRALAKLDALRAKIGGPAQHPDDTTLRIEKDDLLGNVVRAAEFARKEDAERLGKPVDPARWVTTPQMMNAFYDYYSNCIVFPAAILQPPFFDPRADAAVNYGTIGALIGHEMGHGFDDQGRQFGPDGSRVNWWTAEAEHAFAQRAAALAAQYDGYQPLPGTHVNGALTLGENIADLSGVEAAYAAYQKYQARHGKAKVMAGLTGEQRFFLAFAQGRRTKVTEEAQRQLLLIDPHAPSVFRVNGTLRNIDAWYRAFPVQPGDAFYLAPAQRVHLW